MRGNGRKLPRKGNSFADRRPTNAKNQQKENKKMSNVSLIMTRTPVAEFKFGKRSGRWGAMLVVKGAKISSVGFSLNGGYGSGYELGGKSLDIQTADGGGLEIVAEFDTMERFRTNSGEGYYMQVRPRPAQAYMLTMDRSSAVAELNSSGNCLRVHGHGYKKQGTGGTAGILVHEAPHVGWLIGCISPREKNNRVPNHNKQPSRKAMETIFEAMGGFSIGRKADLFVLDW
jgi:hypothetical protein